MARLVEVSKAREGKEGPEFKELEGEGPKAKSRGFLSSFLSGLNLLVKYEVDESAEAKALLKEENK